MQNTVRRKIQQIVHDEQHDPQRGIIFNDNRETVALVRAVRNCLVYIPVLAASDIMATNFPPFMKLFF